MAPPTWEQELEKIAGILDKAPLERTVKWGAPVFTHKGKNVVGYVAFKQFVAIWFYNGVFLSDPFHVLMNAQEGKTKSLRQWRFTSVDEIDEQKIMHYVLEAIEVEEKGLKIVPEKHQPVSVPEVLEAALKADAALKNAFEQLTPGRQKEYSLYIDEAKQAATKLKRLEKIIPIIRSGKGLNDRYK